MPLCVAGIHLYEKYENFWIFSRKHVCAKLSIKNQYNLIEFNWWLKICKEKSSSAIRLNQKIIQ